MPQKPVIDVPQPIGLFAGDLLSRSKQYFAAFEALTEEDLQRLAFPRSHLYFHAVELLLKAFLAATGMQKRDIRKLQHGLAGALGVAIERGMPEMSFDVAAFCRTLDEMNRDQDFRYPTRYRTSMPPPGYCAGVYTAILRQVEATVDAAVAEAEIPFRTQHSGHRVRWSD